MIVRLIPLSVLITSLLGAAFAGPATAQAKLDLGPLYTNIRQLVRQHYPKAQFCLNGRTIHFEYNTRLFMIHEALLTGEWQDAFEERGPQKGGIFCDMELRQGRYAGQLFLPQALDRRYFTDLIMAPYSKKYDCHWYVDLKYPSDVSKEFVAEFARLVHEFEHQ